MRRFWALFIAIAGALCACSGGGGSSSAPVAQPTFHGAGTPAVFNQKITFVIDVPAAPAADASARRRRAARSSIAAASAPRATTPYVSPLTASVVLTLAEVDGVSPQQAPPAIPPINVPAGCQGSSAGCTIPVANVPAALGTDRYFVQTYAGANGTGNLISTGFVDVAVPVKSGQNPAIGSAAALSIGGFVASIALAPSALNFISGTPSDAGVLVQALDAAGATIVGSAQYATPITVTVVDKQNFSFSRAVAGAGSGSNSATVNGPLANPLTLHYGGGNSPIGTVVEATSLDENGAAVSASPLPVNVLPPGSHPTSPPPIGLPTSSPTAAPSSGPTSSPTPLPTSLPTAIPTPTPSATPTPSQALSLYVADAQADTISEYRIVSQIAAGTVPNPAATPSRVFTFDPTLAKSSAIGGAGLSCTPTSGSPTGNGNGTAGVSIDPTSGTIFVLPNCTDGSNGFVFGYPAGAVGAIAPTIYDPFSGGGFGSVNGLASVPGTVWAGYTTNSNALYGFPAASSGRQPTSVIGTACYTEFGIPSPGCFSAQPAGFGVDKNGFLYAGSYWNDTATGDAAALEQPAAVLTIAASETGTTVAPYSAIAGLQSAIGGSSAPPLATTVDGSILYVLTGETVLSPNTSSGAQLAYFPGLSDCPPPGANAPINPIDTSTASPTQCADGQQHLYLAAYSLTAELLGPGAIGADVDLIPNFLIGGDTVGGFGCSGVPGQLLAARGGYVYVINLAPTCPGGTPVGAPEIDVYNTNGVSGAHTDIAPVFRLPLTTGYPLANAIGPSGTVTGGQALLRRPLARPYRPNLYGRRRPLARPRPNSPYSHRLQAPMQTQ